MPKQQKKQPKKSSVCNICGLPGYVQYQEMNKETGLMETKTHMVPCLGHPFIFPHLHNRHPDYTKYRRLANEQRKKSGASHA